MCGASIGFFIAIDIKGANPTRQSFTQRKGPGGIMLTKRQINHVVFAVVVVGGALLFANGLAGGLNTASTLALLSATMLAAGLWAAYWRGWEYARHSAVIVLTLLTAFGINDVQREFDPIVIIAPVMALLLTGPGWMIGSALALLGVLVARAGGQGPYANPSNIIEYIGIIAGMVLSGLATDAAQRLADLNAQAEQARILAERQALRLEEQARELTDRNDEQQRLLDLVTQLETPAVQVADGVLLVPIVGHLDSRRAQALMARLLEEAHAQRARMVILDVAGVSIIDTAVANALMQTAHALRLLGCVVYLSGIASDVATSLVQLGISLDGITPVRSPQEALAHFTTRAGVAARSVYRAN
jgi:rsbT co-antagonist protein RsbR